MAISLESALGFFFTKTLFNRSDCSKNSGCENLVVGSWESKSNDLAGDITIFIAYLLLNKNSYDFEKQK